MDWDQLLIAAAGYFGDKEKRKAELELARVGLAQAQTAAVTAQANAAAAEAKQLIPGISNLALIGGGAALLLTFAGVMVWAWKK